MRPSKIREPRADAGLWGGRVTVSQALGLGILQGATEFLPVSSSGHLVLARRWLGDGAGTRLLFDVIVHLGTLLAIACVLRERIWALLRAAAGWIDGSKPREQETDRRWLGLLVLASIPTAVLGLALRGTVQAMHANPGSVGAALIATGGILLLSERFGRRLRGPSELGWLDALSIGVAQGLAVLPGISRSGATVATALWRGARGETAVEFSILLSVPVVLGAAALELSRAGWGTLGGEALPLLTGFTAAFLTGTLSLKALQWVVTRRRLAPFAAYCAVIGVGALVFA